MEKKKSIKDRKQPEKILISVIVPVYNTENTIRKCLDSLLNQTYKNIEIIAVNDASPDTCAEILETYSQKYSQVKIVTHSENKGLFRARISGVMEAKGKYIAFVDSDDYVSIDWYRLLLKNAEENCADIVMGNNVSIDADGNKYVYNTGLSLTRNRKPLVEKEIFRFLIEGGGMDYSRHVVWNKLYSKELFDKCMPYYQRIDEHFIMTEDISFSFVLYYFAKKMSFINSDCYFYYRNDKSSTKDVAGAKKVEKNVKDLIFSFSFVESFLKEQGVYEEYHLWFKEWKNRYFRWWSYIVQSNTNDASMTSKNIRNTFLNFFEKKAFESCIPQDDSFVDATTTWNESLEKIKREIASPLTQIVSFDIFDTLILRPFLKPTDVFLFLQDDFEMLFSSQIPFAELRKGAETAAREARLYIDSTCNEVTLTEIYKTMAEKYGLSEDKCLKMRDKENEFEIRYCYTRKVGKELYEMALSCGKDVILISDMYLEEDTINEILKKNGYTGHKKLYLSSTRRRLKYNGGLFNEAIKDYPDFVYDEFIHVGDNWNVDYLKAKEIGMRAVFLPKTTDMLFNRIDSNYSGDAVSRSFCNTNSVIDTSIILSNPYVGTLYAIAANVSFDNPFISVNPASDFNRDPYFIGVFPVGMHLLGITKWIADTLKDSPVERIHFIARDGYLPKMVYELFSRYYNKLPKANYIYASRKSMIPAMVQQPLDLLKLKENVSFYNQTPENIFKMYAAVLKEPDNEIIGRLWKHGIKMNEKFKSEESFDLFIFELMEHGFDQKKAVKNFEYCQKYFRNEIKPGDVAFDLGYSGKLQSHICEATGFPVDVFFEHISGSSAETLSSKYGFKINSYYHFAPPMSGIVNEFIFSDYRPSCIGYQEVEGKSVPVFEEKQIAYQEKYLLDEIARGCLDYVENIFEIFYDKLDHFIFQPMDTSLIYEKMLMNDKWFDINLFKFCSLEDEYYGGISNASLSDHWWWQLNHKKVLLVQNGQVYNRENLLYEELYRDGLFIAFYKKINQIFPLGSKRRERIKKLVKKILK